MHLTKVILCLLLVSTPAWAQEEAPEFKLNVNVDLVELHVSVIDDRERPVAGLKQEHFRVMENRIEQPISVFKQEDQPVSLGLVIDNSRSIEPRKQRLDAGALAFVRKSNPADETFVVHFDFEANVRQAFTSSIADLEGTLAGVKPFGQTALYDAIILALKEMENAKYEKKAILVISDGLDNASKATLEQVIEQVKRSRVAIYPVGLLSAAEGEKAERALLEIAEASGGRAYFPNNEAMARQMMEQIARNLREQYTIGYFPTNPNRNGAWRSIRVEITPPIGYPPRLFADYRHGYYGPDND